VVPVSRLADWFAGRGLDDAEILAEIPNSHMDRLSSADQAYLSGLLAQEHAYRLHAGEPACDWNAVRTRDEIDRLLS
jgi:hypothetical protein